MPYKVFLVEDEITTREGIRDSVDWQAAGFELCGEASDGEIALPQIEATQPDVLITDIKMPFMDGLQMTRIVREHMAWMKIIIISGYNDFQYAQEAIKLGVTEYLLKPVSVQDLIAILAKVAVLLDQEKSERAYLKKLRSQVEDNLSLSREKFLLRLVTGGESAISAIEQSQWLGLAVLAPFYQVIVLQVSGADGANPLDFQTCHLVEGLIAGAVSGNKDVLLTKKDVEEFVLILKGENLEQIEQEGTFLVELIREQVERQGLCQLSAGIGEPQKRLGDLHRSFAEALMSVKVSQVEASGDALKKLDHAALRRFLESGSEENFDAFFDKTILPLAEASLRSSLLKHYIIVDLELAVAQFVSDLGGDTRRIFPLGDEDAILAALQTLAQIRAETRRLFAAGIAYRDSQAGNDRATIIRRARQYIDEHFSDSDLSLNEVAARVGFSPNHFSAVFSDETGGTFRDYLTHARIEHAKKLLRTSRLKCSEVAFQCGYNDPHYFSMIFRKNDGMTPQQFRVSIRKLGSPITPGVPVQEGFEDE